MLRRSRPGNTSPKGGANAAMLSLPSTLGQASGASVVQYKGFARIPEGREHDLVTANQTANELLLRGREIEMRLVVSPYGIEGSTTKTLSKMPKKPQGILRKVMSPIPRETTNMQTIQHVVLQVDVYSLKVVQSKGCFVSFIAREINFETETDRVHEEQKTLNLHLLQARSPEEAKKVEESILETCATVYSSIQTVRKDEEEEEEGGSLGPGYLLVSTVQENKEGVDGPRSMASEAGPVGTHARRKLTRTLSDLDLPVSDLTKAAVSECPPSPRTGRKLREIGKKLVSSALRRGGGRPSTLAEMELARPQGSNAAPWFEPRPNAAVRSL